MKTAIEELIDWIEGTQLPKEGAANHIYEKAKQLLEKEKEQICNAYVDGLVGSYMASEQYYNQTYNQNKCFSCGNEKGNYALYCEFCRQ